MKKEQSTLTERAARKLAMWFRRRSEKRLLRTLERLLAERKQHKTA